MPFGWSSLTTCVLLGFFMLTHGMFQAASSAPEDPTAIPVDLLISLTATAGNQQVVIEWEIAKDADIAGFYVLRKEEEEEDYIPLSDLIPIDEVNHPERQYSFLDSDVSNDRTYSYRLEIVSGDGSSSLSGEVSATPLAPTPTSTSSPTSTATHTKTAAPTNTFTPTPTPTQTSTPTQTPSPTATPTFTATSTFTATLTLTPSSTPTPTITPTPTNTRTSLPVYRTPSPTTTIPFVTITIAPVGESQRTPVLRQTPVPLGPSAGEMTRIAAAYVTPTLPPRLPLASATRTLFWFTLGTGGLIGLLVIIGGVGLYLHIRRG